MWNFFHIIVQRCCCCCPGAGRGRPGIRMAAAPAPPAAARAARPTRLRASFCSRWKKTKIYIKSNFREITYDHESVLRIRDVYPGSRILMFTHPGPRISDQKEQQKRGVKKMCCHRYQIPFFCSHKFHKIVNYFSFEVLKKKIWDPGLGAFWPLDPGSVSQTHIFESLLTTFCVKSSIILWNLAQTFFLSSSKIK